MAVIWTAYVVMALLVGVFIVYTVISMVIGAPFVPMDRRNVDEMMRLARIGSGDRVADLGSGDGRVLIAAARAGAMAEGWEINPLLWLWSLLRIRLAGVAGEAKVHLGSYWQRPMGDKDVITLFLIHPQMPRMEKKLRAELKPGARVVSYAFRFPSWPPAAKNEKGMYLYTMPVRQS